MTFNTWLTDRNKINSPRIPKQNEMEPLHLNMISNNPKNSPKQKESRIIKWYKAELKHGISFKLTKDIS